MLVITIDLVPGKFEPMRRTIASMRIANISDRAEVSDYRVEANETSNRLSALHRVTPSALSAVTRAHSPSEEIMKTDPLNSGEEA
jgi:hypothetical protein